MTTQSLGFPILKIQIRYEPDVVTARQKTRKISEFLGFASQDQARMATAVSELARNVFQYAGSGSIEFNFSENQPQTLYMTVTDQGPGISSLGEILNGTYVSKSGMGVGLIGSKKLMDFFEIETGPTTGTKIVMGKSLDRRAAPFKKQDLPLLIDALSSRTPGSAFEEIQNQNRELLTTLDELQASKEELSELNNELAETNRGVVALYAELDEKAASLRRANEVKTSFLSNMTHEFRTPLSSIISLTRLLLDRMDGELTTEQERQVNYIRSSSESLLEIVNDLLDLAKVEAGKISINKSEFSVEELLSGLRGMFRPILGQDSAIDLKFEWTGDNFQFKTDQGKLSQILRNLISNAVKFTERGTINVSASEADNDCVHIKVVDPGMGIQNEFLSIIFEDFSQVESNAHKKHKGTGLGLPLSRKLARLLGGDLWVESTLGFGSTFHILIPREYSGHREAVLFAGNNDAKKSPELSVVPEASEKFKILIIDDDEPSRYILRQLVRSELNADFTEVSNPERALSQLKMNLPDLVFLDLTMPNIDGFEILKSIRAEPEFKDLPIIINTAKILTTAERQELELRANSIISKERSDQLLAVKELRKALSKSGFDYKTT